MAENPAVSSKRKCKLSREPAWALVEILIPPYEPARPEARMSLRME